MEDAVQLLKDRLVLLRSCAKKASAAFVTTTAARVDEDEGLTLEQTIPLLSGTQLSSLLKEGEASNNVDTRMRTIARTVFQGEHGAAQELVKEGEASLAVLESCAQVLILRSYLTAGGID